MPKYDWGLGWPDAKRVERFTRALGGLGTILAAIALAVGVVAAIWVFWRFIEALAGGDDEAIRNVGIIFLAVFGAPFVIWRAIVAQGNLDRSRDRDYADLFTKAIEQLGATREVREWDDDASREIVQHKSNIEVRLGAIYALGRISRDSERDHIAVMEALSAYIRENSPIDESNIIESTKINSYWKPRSAGKFLQDNRPDSDIQAALNVIGNRSKFRIQHEIDAEYHINLRFCNLSGAHLSKRDFSRILFSHSSLIYTYCHSTNFHNSYFDGTDISNSVLFKANFDLAKLDMALLESCNLAEADFSNSEGLKLKQLKHTFGSAGTKLRKRISDIRPDSWSKRNFSGWTQSHSYFERWLISNDDMGE